MDTCARNSEIPHDTLISMAQQESVVLLLKHCQEMKRQESRLRLVTLVLVLGCAAVLVFMQRVNRDCNEKDSFKHAEYSRQQAIDRQGQNLKPNAHLTTSSRCNSVPEDYIQWEHKKTGLVHMQNFTYDEKKYALVVPQGGQYFVYVGVNFRMPHKDKVSGEIHFLSLKVLKFSNRYPDNCSIMEVKDSIPDNRRGARTVYTGQVVALEEGDLLRVSINEDNYELIDCSAETTMYFGAFLL
ncbi:tumor necrosis factor ligand superfamily member 15 [Oncorhynchus nerka]|uniref:tumor necrosis factor ligand superfamily member 15 n=1 Tax=Oncorhynchus nerka TaxID=8023 RepID=UPI00112FD5AF|nr:tumor necrosis factor ligand superfamily member 15-like [Oncorhynchus nerka]